MTEQHYDVVVGAGRDTTKKIVTFKQLPRKIDGSLNLEGITYHLRTRRIYSRALDPEEPQYGNYGVYGDLSLLVYSGNEEWDAAHGADLMLAAETGAHEFRTCYIAHALEQIAPKAPLNEELYRTLQETYSKEFIRVGNEKLKGFRNNLNWGGVNYYHNKILNALRPR